MNSSKIYSNSFQITFCSNMFPFRYYFPNIDKNICCCDKIMHMMQNSRRGKCAPHVWKGVTRRGPKSIVIAPRLGCLPSFLHEVTTKKAFCAQFDIDGGKGGANVEALLRNLLETSKDVETDRVGLVDPCTG